MRDIALFIIVFGALPYILRHPYVGVLVWSWLSYMNPHRMTWGIAYQFPFAQIVAIVLLVSLLLSREPKRFPKSSLLVVWVLFLLWALVTTANAYYPDLAFFQYTKIIKIQLIIFVTMLVMYTPERIKMMVWAIYLAVGFFGIKGGVFTMMTAGVHRVWGPPGSFIEGNNELAIALLMVLPLGVYLAKHEATNAWVKRGLWLSMFLITISIVASYSRGAFLAIICVAGFLWLKSRKKIISLLFVLPLLPVIFLLMPDAWHERMSTIQSYEQDGSAMGRINAWKYAINVANGRITGAGLESWTSQNFATWGADPERAKVAHSIYFSVLADHGWIGLLMFLAIFGGAFVVARRVARAAEGSLEHAWTGDLAKMIQVSLVAYGTGGAFLSLSYFDLPWHLIAIVLLLQQFLKNEGVWERKKTKFSANMMRAPRESR